MTLLREQVIFPGPEEEGGDGQAQERSWEREALSWHHGQGDEAAVSCAWRSECFWIIGPQISSVWALILSFCLLTGCSTASSYNSGCSNFLYFFLPIVLFGFAWLPTSCLFGFLFFLNKRLFSLSALGCRVEFQSRTVLAQDLEEESFLELFWKTFWLPQPVSSLVSCGWVLRCEHMAMSAGLWAQTAAAEFDF